jgi:hypothetical protein
MSITSYPIPPIKADIGDYTSKGRLKVSNPEVIFFNTFQYGIETDVWDSSTTNGGAVAFDATISAVAMSVTSTLNSECIRQTLNVQRYIPGRSSELTFAVRLETPVAGIRRRFGLFDGIDGIYFEDNGGDYACVIINSDGGTPTIDRIARADWNGDKLDGAGESGFTADATKQQIICIDYEWYGSGQVIFSFVIGGEKRVIHTFNTGNVLSVPWCKTPFLPIRLELKNTTGATGTHYMYQGSNSLVIEGTATRLGTLQNIITPPAGVVLTIANTFYPVLSVRLKSTTLKGVVLPISFQAATLDNTSVYYKIIRNTTLNGTWVDMPDTNAFTQYNYTSTGAISGGIVLESGFIVSGSTSIITMPSLANYQLGRSVLGTVSDTVTIAIAAVNANKDGVASLTWIEQR